MRGRLRDNVDGDVQAEKSTREGTVMKDYGLPNDAEIPEYDDMGPYFSIKLHYGGKFNEDCTDYVGGK